MNNQARIERMRALLEAAFAPEALAITDDSHRHAGHAGARDGRGHFTLEITSAAFEGLGPVARHRAIYAVLDGMMRSDIHALAIRAGAPGDQRVQ